MVSTTLGAEGIDVTHGENILLVDDPNDFADQVIRVLSDGELGARLGEGARRLAVERYSWKASAKELVRFYGELGAPG
jgi:glycosyltransferase involved in cell wall biosynthesis